MIRKLKTLGLALVAVFAMSAMAASAAQAEVPAGFWSEGEDIDAIGETTQTFESPKFGTLTCTEVSGTSVLAAESPELTGENIAYETCHTVKFGITFPITVTMNSCDYTFTAGTLVEEGTKSEGSVHIECTTEGDSITIDVYKAGTPNTMEAHTNPENLQCLIHVPEQTPEGVVTYHNTTTEGVMAVTVTADSLKVTETVTNLKKLGCSEHVHDKATYKGSFWAKGTDVNKNYVDTTVTSIE